MCSDSLKPGKAGRRIEVFLDCLNAHVVTHLHSPLLLDDRFVFCCVLYCFRCLSLFLCMVACFLLVSSLFAHTGLH